MNKKEYVKLVKQFEQASIENANRGCGHPDDVPEIRKHYLITRTNMLSAYDRIQEETQ